MLWVFYSYSYEVFYIGLLLCLGCIANIAIGLDNSSTLTNLTDEVQMMMVQENSVIGVSSLLTVQELEWYEILEKDYKEVLNGSVKYGKLIDCLIQCESTGNTQATGDSGRAFGILQFWKSTFDQYSKEYGLALDYANPTHQILLCDKMLQEDFNNINHWLNCKNQCLR